MEIRELTPSGVLLIHPAVHGDARGYFFELFNARDLASRGLDLDFVQDNVSRSRYGVVRGLHFQRAPHAQSKLVSVLRGRILDVAVDLRPDSTTYGQHVAVELSDENHHQLLIPQGFAHGFSVLSQEAIVHYKCDAYWVPSSEGGVHALDPNLGIDWGLPPAQIILSERDAHHPPLNRTGLPA